MGKKNTAAPAATSGKLKGAEGFEQYYQDLFTTRWPALKEALLKESSLSFWEFPYFSLFSAYSLELSIMIIRAP